LCKTCDYCETGRDLGRAKRADNATDSFHHGMPGKIGETSLREAGMIRHGVRFNRQPGELVLFALT
jgi:hypothetical protein